MAIKAVHFFLAPIQNLPRFVIIIKISMINEI